MKKILTAVVFFLLIGSGFSQYKVAQNFETTSPGSLPSGWTRYNRAAFNIYSASNWTVRDSGSTIYQVNPTHFLAKCRSGKRSIAVSYYSGFDSTGNNIVHNSNAWFVSPRFACASNDSISFYATGGSQQYYDSLQVWVNTSNTLPENFTVRIGTIYWPEGSQYGKFVRYRYSLSQFAGQTIAIGFKYNMDLNFPNSGLLVQLDDIYVGPSVGIQNISADVPSSFKLSQNYPNPFNPVTNIAFDIPKNTFAILKVYDMLGREVETLVNEKLDAGYYRVDFNASNISSGTYFYSLVTSDFVQTRKLTVVK
ncbi:MAG: T9SS type A sorting domain-containing protein [Ignavibacteria bacterium]|nr:T9SS type A sorting domain-containing protein [Ignavibacteria bacterium]